MSLRLSETDTDTVGEVFIVKWWSSGPAPSPWATGGEYQFSFTQRCSKVDQRWGHDGSDRHSVEVIHILLVVQWRQLLIPRRVVNGARV
jgi:hypothetical protein